MEESAPDLETIFSRAIEIESPEERARFIAEACRGRDQLRGEVEKLLRADANPENLLETPVFRRPSITEVLDAGEGPGTVIGPYKLLEMIAAGGMGTVYMAEQTLPIRRRVALKMINPGMDSRHVIARFEAERQALALMDHPNISTVFDAGTTETGRPYFVMELIRGLPITEYCDRKKLSITERLKLFVQVCRAIQHAHQKAIVHRDLKPSNVLVTEHDGVPVTKVIDFGIAKAIGRPLTDKTLFTGFRQLIGTTLYMSPEQAMLSGQDVDTRSDIYSLGVLLYELLTGTTPFDADTIRKAAFDEAMRIIREVEPPRPSTRLSSLGATETEVSANRGLDPSGLEKLIRGELDWIVMKTLEKQPSRRYETSSELARDIERYLADEPVEARPPSSLYRLSKFAMRHRVGLLASSLIALSVLATAIISLIMAVRAARSEADSLAVQHFYRDKVLGAARPKDWEGGLGRDVSLRTVLDTAEASVAASFARRPLVEAGVRHTLGMNYYYLGDAQKAIRQLEQSHALRKIHQGPSHPETLLNLNDLSSAYAESGKYDLAARLAREAFEGRKATLGPFHPDTLTSLNNLASDLKGDGHQAEAISLFEQVLALRQAHVGRDDPATLVTMNNLGVVYLDDGQITKAVDLLKRALELQNAKPGPGHPETLLTMNNLAVAYSHSGQAAEAIPLFERVFEAQKANLGPAHPETLGTMNNLAAASWTVGRKARAVELFEQALLVQKVNSGPTHPSTLLMTYNLAICYRATGQPVKAVPLFEEALEAYRVKPGVEDLGTLTTMNNLAGSYLDVKDYDAAEPLLRECLKLRAKIGPDTWERFQTMSQLGAALDGRNEKAEAEPMLVQGYEGLEARVAQIPEVIRARKIGEAAARIVPFYEAWGKLEKAAEWRDKLKAKTAAMKPTP